MGDILSPRIKLAKSTPVKRQHKGPFMEVMIGDNVKPGRSIGIERDETDYVSAWILALAVGMIVLARCSPCSIGAIFSHHFPPRPQSHMPILR